MPQKQKRRRYTSLKPAKRALRKGDHFAAITLLAGHRDSLLRKLNRLPLETDQRPLKTELALVNHQLSLAYHAVGNHKMADKRSGQAIENYNGPNHLGFAMLLRDDGWRMLGRSKIIEAEQLILQAIDKIQALREPVENVPVERIDMEHWVTQGYFGQILIAKGEKAKGIALMRAADEFLKDGSKRYRELDNLMALIPHTGLIEQRRLALRATKLNEMHVHNSHKRIWLGLVLAGGTPLARISKAFLR